jgi:ParB/RepB/Spo0J family partition protein
MKEISMSVKQEKAMISLSRITATNNPRCPCRKLVQALKEEGYEDWKPLQLVHDMALSGNEKDRKEFCRLVEKYETDPQDLIELAASRRKHAIQPIVVRSTQTKGETTYALVAGERRYLAAAYNYAKWGEKPEIGAEIITASSDDAYDIAVQENLNRKDATEIEKGEIFRAYRLKVNPTTNKKFTLREIAGRLSIDYQYVRSRESLTYLSDADKRAVEEGRLGLTRAAEKGTRIRQRKTDQNEPVAPKKHTRNRMFTLKQAHDWFDAHRNESEDYMRALSDAMRTPLKQALRDSDKRLKDAKEKEVDAA